MQPAEGERYADLTFGAGGYSKAMLDAADCKVIAFDRDPDAIEAGQAMVKQASADRLQLVEVGLW